MDTVEACIAVVIVLFILGLFTGAIIETLQEHEYKMAQLECAPKVCRTEHGHRKECDQ